jgi:hypothetical protein
VDRDARKAENESLFRDVNERLEDTALRWGSAEHKIAFLCECADLECIDRVELTVAQYEHVRASPTRFAIVPGHADPALEDVTERYPDVEVVTKRGEAATRAEVDDPRS